MTYLVYLIPKGGHLIFPLLYDKIISNNFKYIMTRKYSEKSYFTELQIHSHTSKKINTNINLLNVF